MTEHDPLIEEMARVIFRCNFAADEDEATVAEKWIEWASSQRKAIMTATAILPFLERARIAGAKAGLEAAAGVAEMAAKEWTRTTTSLEVKASPVFVASIQAAEIIARNVRNLAPAAIAGAGEG